MILTADDDANTVAEWTTTGNLVGQIAAPLGRGNGQLDEPRDADTDSHGDIYVADFANNRMAKFGPGGKWLRNWGTKGSANGRFARPYGVAVDATDHVYVADSNNERIQEFTRKGRYVAKWGKRGQFTQLRRVAVGGGTRPNVYGADLWGNHVTSFRHSGGVVRRWGHNHPAVGGFNEPSGLAVGTQTYVADTVNQRMERFTTATGVFRQAWGARGWRRPI